MTKIFIRSNIPGFDIFVKSIKEDIIQYIISDDNLDGFSIQDCSRIGFVYDNTYQKIPFGNEPFVSNDYTFQYFTKELFDLFSQISSPADIDIISCNMSEPRFISEVAKIKTLLPNVNINYSLNATGGSIGSDWIMESNGVSLRNIYFNDNIVNYKYSLGGSGNFHSAFIANDGSVWTFGYNIFGQLGNGTTIDSNIPVATGITNAIYVSCGQMHTLVLKSDGTVWSFGFNNNGQLGLGYTSLSVSVPTQIPAINDAVYVSTGVYFSAILRSNGKVYTFGHNYYGQLGTGDIIDKYIPTEMIGITNAIMVMCGATYTMVVKSDGTVWGSGFNSNGELGDGTNVNKTTAVASIGVTDAISVACGATHTIVLRSNKTLLAYGANNAGQLGNGSFIGSLIPIPIPGITDVSCISCGAYYTLVLKTNGTVFSFGNNLSGQLGDGTTTASPLPIQIPGITDAISVTAGGIDTGSNLALTMILRANGTIIAVGGGVYGSLGDGTYTSSLMFVNVILNEGQTASKLFDALIGGILCVREGSLVRTKRGRIPIEEVISGDVVYRLNDQEVEVVYNIKLLEKTNKFIKINKGALSLDNKYSQQSPSQDLFITKGHPILFRGGKWFPENLSKRITGTSEVVTDDYYYVYCLCTKDSVFVDIDNVFVCTKSEKTWNNRKRVLLWTKQ
jgi:hypothetical protein